MANPYPEWTSGRPIDLWKRMKEILKFYETLCCTKTPWLCFAMRQWLPHLQTNIPKKEWMLRWRWSTHINSGKYLNSYGYWSDSQRRQRNSWPHSEANTLWLVSRVAPLAPLTRAQENLREAETPKCRNCDLKLNSNLTSSWTQESLHSKLMQAIAYE